MVFLILLAWFFSKDRKISLSGEELTKISVENEFMAPALKELLLSESEQFGKVPIDFRSLSVREFGTIYEVLLESEFSIAEENLTINIVNLIRCCLVFQQEQFLAPQKFVQWKL